MKIVIDILPEEYEAICKVDSVVNVIPFRIAHVIKDGIILPENHGRLIDADELYGDFIDGTEGYDCQTWNRIEIGDIIDDAQTIIEADMGSEG